MNASDFFTLPASLLPFAEFFLPNAYPWDWVRRIAPALEVERFIARQRNLPSGVAMEGFVYIHPSVVLPAHATIIGPVWLGEGSVLMPGVVLNGHVIAGKGCTFGAGGYFQNCLLLDQVRTSPLVVVTDSVLGNETFVGVRTSLIAQRQEPKSSPAPRQVGPSDYRAEGLGALVGDAAEVGHHTVLRPGSVLWPRTQVAAGCVFSGVLAQENA